jgi:DNA-binding CsgD family transcriptional regulator
MITIAPVSRRISSEVTGAERIAAVVLAIRPADASRGSITASRLFDLTRMEARVLAALQEHPGLPGVALRFGIARSTARTHLQSIFGKTGARNQAELLRLVTSLGVARGR